jgi:hypothetical protein
MEYLLLIHSDDEAFEKMPKDTQMAALQAYGAYSEALAKAGVLRSANRLRRARDATVVSVREGKTHVHAGPFADTREELGGYYLIDVGNLDTALSWAAKCPGASHGKVEVRPVWEMGAP